MSGKFADHKHACLLFILIIFPIVLAGCPSPQDNNGGEQSDQNLLPIPPSGTIFTFDGEPLEWNVQPHPRILANPDGVELLRNVMVSSDLGHYSLHDNLLNLANEQLGILQAGGTPDGAGPVAWAWGYLITGDEKFLDAARGALDFLLNFQKLVRYPEGANISFLQQAYVLGALYDLLYDYWTVDEITKIETALRDTVFHSLAYKVTEYDTDINFWAMDPDTNYYLTFHSTAGLIAVLLMGDVPEAEALAEHCYTRVKESMDAIASENGWREGLTYLDFCWGQSACYFLLAIERNTSEKPYELSWFEASARWAAWGELPDRVTIACFGDNEPENYSVGSYIARVEALSGIFPYDENHHSGRALVSDIPFFAAACLRRPPVQNAWISDENSVFAKYLPGIEWGFVRNRIDSIADEDEFYIALKSGVAGYDHNHLDQGSFILSAYSDVLISDPGRGGSDVIRQDPYINCLYEAGLGHNTLIVGDGCYEDLGLFPDNPEYFAGPGKITSFIENENFVQFTSDNSGLYPTEPLLSYLRTFLYIKPSVVRPDNGVLIIADHVEFSEPLVHSFLFHTPGTVSPFETGKAFLMNGNARLEYYGYSSIDTTDRFERQESDIHERDSTCYYRSSSGEFAQSDWIHVLVPVRSIISSVYEPVISYVNGRMEITFADLMIPLDFDTEKGWIFLRTDV